ncbi:hypothetical protein BKA61DRAFT_484723 [Leptodontidium sp. MPI-SDFR-AT-0119]|nr:hypothetical protein BKA61DRAFT_484723 [Leptodontidium sp. MPI-SDFR-AT-0119]
MRLTTSFLSLPTSILLLIASHTTAHSPSADQSSSPSIEQWPYNLPPHVKFWPEDPPSRRRDLEAIEEHIRLGRKPVGVMKMSDDDGEKFYMEYWQFEGELEQTGLFEPQTPNTALRRRDKLDEEETLSGNETLIMQFKPPFMLHTESAFTAEELKAREILNAAGVLAALEKRDFTCPTGTSDCSGIGFPGSCCTTNEVCFKITDTGLGRVGCCPAGASCGGTITTCDAPNTPCSAALGGGCCIPNFSCVEGGCALDPAVVVTTIITRTFTVTASSSTRTTTSVSTVTSTSATASSSSSSSSTSVSTSLTTTTSATGVLPVRPTSGTSSTTTPTTSSDLGPTTCPTGFYACQAYYEGGCCRTGRNCEKTSCPPISSTTIISSGVTIVVPVGSAAAVATPTGACASGWQTCPASVGGNCCPNGWGCGTASCSSVGPTNTAVLQKASPGIGDRISGDWRIMVGVVVMTGLFVVV